MNTNNTKSSFNSRRYMRGITLVEMMVAMLIGLVLIGGSVSIFTTTQQTNRTQEALSRVQESGRFAIERIAFDARQAGLSGCAGNINNLLDVNDGGYDPTLHSNDVQAFSPPPNPLPASHERGDVLTINYMRPSGRNLSATGNGSGNVPPIVLDGSEAGMPQGTVIQVIDTTGTVCERFQHNAASNAGNLSRSQSPKGPGNLGPSDVNYTEFNGPIDILLLSSVLYFVGESDAKANISSLYRWDMLSNTPAIEIVEGVHDMRIEYGLDDNNNNQVDRFVSSVNMNADDWENAVSVRVHLLVHNGFEDNVVDQARENIFFAGTMFDATDRRLYQTFTTTIAARNRLE